MLYYYEQLDLDEGVDNKIYFDSYYEMVLHSFEFYERSKNSDKVVIYFGFPNPITYCCVGDNTLISLLNYYKFYEEDYNGISTELSPIQILKDIPASIAWYFHVEIYDVTDDWQLRLSELQIEYLISNLVE